ncbi:hypothetical protein [Chitinophaga skermanii]|nr:hypothetical protein [Chitinophaga skermanii]
MVVGQILNRQQLQQINGGLASIDLCWDGYVLDCVQCPRDCACDFLWEGEYHCHP